jgi:hypothetical protein
MTNFLHAIVAIIAPFLMPVTVEATAYTCEPITGNPMNAPGMCIALANGSREVASPGMACPSAWMGMGFYVPGQGTLYCDDTGAHTFLYTAKGVLRPHTDMRFSTLSAAWRWGKQTIVIYQIRPPRKDAPHAPTRRLLCHIPVGPCRADDLALHHRAQRARWN